MSRKMTATNFEKSLKNLMAEGPQPSTSPDLTKFLQNQDSKKLAQWVLDGYTRAKEDRGRAQRQWYLNLSFYYGKHFVQYLNPGGVPGDAATRLRTPPVPPWRTRIAINRIRAAIRTEYSKLTSQKPNASVVPSSSEDEDLMAAQAGEQVWESLYSRKKIHREFGRAVFWLNMTGNGFLKNYWDPSAVDPSNPDTIGDIVISPVTPFHLFVPDLREQEIEDQPFVLHIHTKPLEWVEMFFGDKCPPGLKNNVVSVNEVLSDSVIDLSTSSKPDAVLLIEAWVKPGATKLMPEGGRIVVCGSEVIDANMGGLPYQHGEFPFVHFTHIPTGKFYAESSITDLIPLQREYNRTRGQVIDAKNRMAKPQLLSPKGAINPAKITSEPGLVIEYRPGYAPPQPMPLSPLPNYVMQEMQQTLMDIDDISGQHEVSKGQTPPGVTAATAISYLQEQDDSKLSHTYQSIEFGMEKLAKQTLSHVVQYWDLPRLVKIVGEDQAFDAVKLTGADIKNGTDIRMEAGSALPVSKAARQAFLLDMMKFGFIPPQEGLKLMEIGGVQRLNDQLRVDERQAQRENLRMKGTDPEEINAHIEEWAARQENGDPTTFTSGMDGMPPEPMEPPPLVPVNTWDNHPVHIEVHNRFRKSQAFEMLPPEVQQVFEQHVMLHVDAINQAQMAAMGAGPEGEGPSGPPGEPGQEEAPPGNGGANQFQPPME